MDRIKRLEGGVLAPRREFLLGTGAVIGLAAAGRGFAQSQETVVPIRVVRAPSGATLALVPIYIDDQGPFTFALDTGASRSLIDKPLVKKLDLKEVGKKEEITGVACSTGIRMVEVRNWRVGEVRLPASIVTTLELPEPNGKHGLQGLLGSDILSRYGSFTLNYKTQELTLR